MGTRNITPLSKKPCPHGLVAWDTHCMLALFLQILVALAAIQQGRNREE